MSHHHRKKFNLAHTLKGFGKDLKPASHLIKEVVETPIHAIDKIGNVAQSAMLPMLIIGGIVLFVIVKDKL
jgi:hypothetical protein